MDLQTSKGLVEQKQCTSVLVKALNQYFGKDTAIQLFSAQVDNNTVIFPDLEASDIVTLASKISVSQIIQLYWVSLQESLKQLITKEADQKEILETQLIELQNEITNCSRLLIYLPKISENTDNMQNQDASAREPSRTAQPEVLPYTHIDLNCTYVKDNASATVVRIQPAAQLDRELDMVLTALKDHNTSSYSLSIKSVHASGNGVAKVLEVYVDGKVITIEDAIILMEKFQMEISAPDSTLPTAQFAHLLHQPNITAESAQNPVLQEITDYV